MRFPAPILQSFEKNPTEGMRYVLIGKDGFVLQCFRDMFSGYVTNITISEISPLDLRASYLGLRDQLLTNPLPWERPLIWIQEADLLLGQMSHPDDFPASRHTLVFTTSSREVYVPPSFIPVDLEPTGKENQDLIRWMFLKRGLNAEPAVIKFFSTEFKDSLGDLYKFLDQLHLLIHPRTVVSLKDIDAEETDTWDSTGMIHSIVNNEEQKVLAEAVKALTTFHPKGVVTVLTRRVSLLMQVAAVKVLGEAASDQNAIKPWVWRQNEELVKDIPLKRLANWGVILDRTQSALSTGKGSMRWILLNALIEMTRSV